jgi:uncharacterized protein YxeA
MNKKTFIGVTLITATVVGGVVYFRHKILEQVDKWLDTEDVPEPLDLTPEERDAFVEGTLKRGLP